MIPYVDTILLLKWLKMDVDESNIVWSEYNGCHMPQDDVIKFWVALRPSFLDSYGVLRFPEQGFDQIVGLWRTKFQVPNFIF